MEPIPLIVFVGGSAGDAGVERALRRAKQAAARDLIEQALRLSCFAPIILASDDPAWIQSLADLPVRAQLDPPDEPFHFGRTLARLIQDYDLSRCFYVGGGSAPLLPDQVLLEAAQAVAGAQRLVVTNNLHSTDWAAFAPAGAMPPLAPWLDQDNALAWVLQERAGLPVRARPKSTASQMDIDTPFDLLALAKHPATQPHLRSALAELDWPTDHLDAALAVLRTPASQVIVAGRVSSWTWQLLERSTRCWVRVFAEERGMRSSRRQARGEVRSLLNDYLNLVGVEQFFVRLADMADAIFVDSRVILAARRLWPSDADRFNADLLRAQEVGEPFLRDLTLAARQAPVPVVMGGHSLVASGLAVLLEALQAEAVPDTG